MRDVVDQVLPLAGPILVGLTLALWARYALIRFGEDEQVPRLTTPLVPTVLLVLLLVVIAALEQPTT